jgi:hypothetical protein
MIDDWNTKASAASVVDLSIHILRKFFNRNFQKERFKESGCLLHLKERETTLKSAETISHPLG